ncbi:MAG: efflux RND transporter periplasmic adaptor subunit [Anaerovoracaceae bacterium]
MKIRGRAAGKAAENKEKIRTKIRGRYVAAFIIAAICLAVLVPFAKGLMTPKQQPPEEAVLTVQEEYPAIRSIQNTARVVGNVKSDDARTIIAKAAGEVVTLNVSEGDQVSAGDIICIIDSDSLTSSMLSRDSAQSSVSSAQIQVENSRLQVKNAQNDLKDAKENVEKYSILYEDGSISKAEMESYEKAVTNAESQLSSAENSLSQAQYSLQQAQYSYEMACDSYNTLYDSLYVKATSAGVIESLDIDLHDNITAQTKICTISQKTQMKLICSVASSVASEISAGDDVTVTQKGNTYAGTIESVGSDADASTGTYEVKILLADASEMAVNSKATAYLKTKKSDQALTVPYSCVYYDEGKPYVYVDTDGTAAVRYIETGIHDDDYIAVTGGLNENDAVITSWSSSLTGGSLVQKAVNE